MKRYEALIRVTIDAPSKQLAEILARMARDAADSGGDGDAEIDHAELVEVRLLAQEAESRIDHALARIAEFPHDASWIIGEILRGEQ
jgi:hypothetical protein